MTEGDDLESRAFRYVDCFAVALRDLVAGRTASGTSPPGGWVGAGHLRTGDRLVTSSGATATVLASIREDHIADGGIAVYNFEVEGTHTYAVTSGTWVHNACNLEVGPYGRLAKSNRAAQRAGAFHAHHAPQKELMKSLGIDPDDAIAINIRARIHRGTSTYGAKPSYGRTLGDYLDDDISKLRGLLRAEGNYSAKNIENALRRFRRQNYRLWERHGLSRTTVVPGP